MAHPGPTAGKIQAAEIGAGWEGEACRSKVNIGLPYSRATNCDVTGLIFRLGELEGGTGSQHQGPAEVKEDSMGKPQNAQDTRAKGSQPFLLVRSCWLMASEWGEVPLVQN